jgi:hypothetical protein
VSGSDSKEALTVKAFLGDTNTPDDGANLTAPFDQPPLRMWMEQPGAAEFAWTKHERNERNPQLRWLSHFPVGPCGLGTNYLLVCWEISCRLSEAKNPVEIFPWRPSRGRSTSQGVRAGQ